MYFFVATNIPDVVQTIVTDEVMEKATNLTTVAVNETSMSATLQPKDLPIDTMTTVSY